MNPNPFPKYERSALPAVTVNEMIEVDRLMTEVYHIELKQMMENAGRHLARLCTDRFLDFGGHAPKVYLLCGSGGNGGGGLVCARRLAGWGVDVHIVLSKPASKFSGVPAHQLRIAQHLGLPVLQPADLTAAAAPALIIDAIIGYSLTGAAQGNAKTLIEWANTQSAPVVSLDIPSGMEGDRGAVYEPAVRARATLTLALPKKGLLTGTAQSYTGRLFIADISVPPHLYSQAFGWEVPPLFAENEIIELI